jgi:hypothetical protein
MSGTTDEDPRNSVRRRSAAGRADDDKRNGDAYTFLVRLWKEPREEAGAEPTWRGTLSDLQGRPLGSFTSAADLAAILHEMAGLSVLLRFSCSDAEPTGGQPAHQTLRSPPCT